MNIEKLSVIDFYNGKSILITGGTGDMGKLLVEKLLRCFPKLGCIYLLIRDKKATMASERLSTLLDSPVFDELRHCSPNIFSKVRIIEGDLCVSDLGLSKANQKILIEKVSIVFHCAANVRFNVPLEEAININLFGTRRLLELCHNMIQIEVFIHVSTLFSTCYKKTIEECIPFIPAINGVVDFTQNEDDVMKAIPPELVKNWPNTYTFSKALTEIMLKDLRGKIPVGIVRPSIIVSSLKEPMPGWINSFYGPTYMITNAALGILRTSICETNNTAHGIPSDMVINLLLCVAPKTKYEGVEKIEVYNFCTSRQNRLTVKLLFEETEKIFRMYPLMRAIRYPNHTLRTSEIIHAVVTAVQHRLFGYVFDLIALCTFRKPSLSRIYSSLSKHATNTKFFTLNDFTVFGHNVERLNADLSEREREIFYFDVKTLNWMSFLRDYALGIRKYLLKEDLMNLGEAVPRMKKIYWIEKFLQSFVSLTSLFLIYFFIRNRCRRYNRRI